MFYPDSYATSAGSVAVTSTIRSSILKCFAQHDLHKINLNLRSEGKVKPVFITGKYDGEAAIPLFDHPMIIEYKGDEYLCTDLRLCLRKQASDDEPVEQRIRVRADYNLAKSRAALNLAWLNEDRDTLKTSMNFSTRVFGAWIADIVAKVHSLDFGDQTRMAVLATLYYQSLFSQGQAGDQFSEDSIRRMTVHSIGATGAPSKEVFAIADTIKEFGGLNGFCAAVRGFEPDGKTPLANPIFDNIRLKSFSATDLYNVLATSWYGTKAKEIISVSLEHPPSWMALIYTAMSEKSFSKSTVSQLVERYGKRGMSDQYEMAYRSYVTERMVTSEEIKLKYESYLLTNDDIVIPEFN